MTVLNASWRVLCSSAAPIALLVIPAMAQAQQAATATPQAPGASQTDASQANDGISDIVVTARRVDERAQQVPVAITAFSQENLRSNAVNTGTDLQNFTPSLSVLGDVARNQETYAIRGMGGNAGQGSGSGPGWNRRTSSKVP